MLDVSLVIALIVGIVEAAKRSGMKSSWAPLLSLVLGVMYSLSFGGSGDYGTSIIQGIIIGLSSAGLYSGTKKVLE